KLDKIGILSPQRHFSCGPGPGFSQHDFRFSGEPMVNRFTAKRRRSQVVAGSKPSRTAGLPGARHAVRDGYDQVISSASHTAASAKPCPHAFAEGSQLFASAFALLAGS